MSPRIVHRTDDGRNEELLPSRRQEVSEILAAASFTPLEFVWIAAPSKFMPGWTVSKLEHRATRYFFQFDWMEYHEADTAPQVLMASVMSPGNLMRQEMEGTRIWHLQKGAFAGWCQRLRRELSAFDPWAVLSASMGRDHYSGVGHLVDGPISPGLARELHLRLDQLCAAVEARAQLNSEQLDGLRLSVVELKKATTRLSTKDWMLVFLGTALTWAIDLAIDVNILRPMLVETWKSLCSLTGSSTGTLLK